MACAVTKTRLCYTDYEQGQEICSLNCPYLTWGPTNLLQVLKLPGHEADHSHSTTVVMTDDLGCFPRFLDAITGEMS